MPRKPRNDFEPGIHHVYARGNNREPIFFDDADRRAYLGLLGQSAERYRWRYLSYCLMPNHVHLLVETTTPNLSAGVQWVHGSYGRLINRRHDRCGHLFQGRFGSKRMEDDAQLWMTLAYIARNPVAAGLCKSCDGWKWSSHVAIANDDHGGWLDVERVLGFLGMFGGDPLERYRQIAAG
jgi:putative transposase